MKLIMQVQDLGDSEDLRQNYPASRAALVITIIVAENQFIHVLRITGLPETGQDTDGFNNIEIHAMDIHQQNFSIPSENPSMRRSSYGHVLRNLQTSKAHFSD